MATELPFNGGPIHTRDVVDPATESVMGVGWALYSERHAAPR